MKVIKRDGSIQNIHFDKILNRITKLVGGPEGDQRFSYLSKINIIDLVKKIIERVYDGVHTIELDNQCIQSCMSVSSIELEYSELAKRTFISSMHKSFATETFKENCNNTLT